MRGFLFLLSLTGFLIGCGGSGGSGGSTQPPTASTADLRLLLGDNAINDIDRFLLTVDGVTLLGDDGQLALPFNGPKTFDLLALQNLAEVLIDAEVPAGSYSKIRLSVTEIELQRVDSEGVVTWNEFPPLPAGGKIDLNPQGDVDLAAGDVVTIEIDFDLDRSVQLTATGGGGYRVRPVVFIDIIVTPGSGRITLLSGVVSELDGETLALCDPLDLDDCTDLSLSEVEVLLDENGDPVEIGALFDDLVITVFGRYGADEVFNVLALATTAEDGISRLEGTVAAPLEVDRFLFDLEDSGNTTIELAQGTLIRGDDGEVLTTESLVPDVEAEIWGITRADESSTVALLIQLDDEDAADEEDDDFEGRFVAYSEPELTLAGEDALEFCVTLSETTEIILIAEEVEDNETYVGTSSITLAEFGAAVAAEEITGAEVEYEAYGNPGETCIDAEVLVIEND